MSYRFYLLVLEFCEGLPLMMNAYELLDGLQKLIDRRNTVSYTFEFAVIPFDSLSGMDVEVQIP